MQQDLLTAQIRRDAVWCFGDSAYVDFNQTPPVLGRSSVKGRGTAASITDITGNILFYTHTFYLPLWSTGYTRLTVVYNSNHVLMEGGDSLVGAGWYKENSIIPNPSNNSQYYLIHSGITSEDGLFYSIIDMSYNGGLGKVIQKNIQLNNLAISEGFAAIKHGNGRDWWVMFKSNFTTNNDFYRYLITPSGISPLMTQSIGNSSFSNLHPMRFSADGTKLLVCNLVGLVEVYDFDRCTGILSNRILVNPETFLLTERFMDEEFSGDGTKIYLHSNDTTSYLYQYDLTAPNIGASRQTISTINSPYYTGGALKLAPDNKIYWSNIYNDGINFPFPYPDTTYNTTNMNLSVINYPDSAGSACNFQPYSFYLGGARTYFGLPNNPNYDLPALASNPCPVAMEELESETSKIVIYPNPASDVVNITTEKKEIPHIIITDCSGNKVCDAHGRQISLKELSNGVYAVHVIVANKTLGIKKLVVLK